MDDAHARAEVFGIQNRRAPRPRRSSITTIRPCRDKTVPATKCPVAWTVLSKRCPCKGQDCPCYEVPRGLDSPVQALPLQGQDCPCYEVPCGLDSPIQALPLQGQDCPCYASFCGLDSPVQALPLQGQDSPCYEVPCGLDSPVQALPLQGQDCPCYASFCGLDSPVQALPLQGHDCPCYEVPCGLDSPVQAFPPAGTGQSLLRSAPWLGQSCPSISSCRDKTVPATKFPVAWTVLSKHFLLQGQDSPCYEVPCGLDSPVQAFPPAGTRLSLLRDFSNTLADACHSPRGHRRRLTLWYQSSLWRKRSSRKSSASVEQPFSTEVS
ncbi:MAG: hypothetical protein KatS3mg019_2236 [Fimbriimonadales bacterium]|nr:MAG: hypothetical protein KatS3mg019_2236 [Fimbriimonadales bacterium]